MASLSCCCNFHPFRIKSGEIIVGDLGGEREPYRTFFRVGDKKFFFQELFENAACCFPSRNG
ncbi:hypothetical protein C2E25_01280 [Geothermobacter hydrogeniphilus]|uniref:Uncharacterized protein n=1 Tax=Geothermobacter hydrogeniphilus TaxID=1969733 RepID=A0A2K2HE48_9BACT|nr:hypothetical protein C2E25_01280 [Geothermobacter hydrogeniphilus]